MTDSHDGSGDVLTLGGDLTLHQEPPPWYQRFTMRLCVAIMFVLLAAGSLVYGLSLSAAREDLQDQIARDNLISRDEAACRAELVANLQIANSDLSATETELTYLYVRDSVTPGSVSPDQFTAVLDTVDSLKERRLFAREQAANAEACRLFG